MLSGKDMQGPFGTWTPATGKPSRLDSVDIESARSAVRPMEFPVVPRWSYRGRAVRYIAVGLLLLTMTLVVISARHNPLDTASKRALGPAAVRYAFRESYHRYNASSTSLRIAIISDKDKGSKTSDGKAWESDLMTGTLTRDPSTGEYSVSWDSEPIKLKSQLNEDGRAMELSELAYFNNRLLAFDDRTGLVAEIDIEKKIAVPIHIAMEGDGHTGKGQKTEWATVKDGLLYFGSIGKEWTNSTGGVVNFNNQWVKTMDNEGRIAHVNWRPVYENIRSATGTKYPGYVIHEAVCWNTESRKWFFMPRRLSAESYDDAADESRASNTIISFDEELQTPCTRKVGPLEPTHGFSSCKFVPFRENEVVVLKTMEYKGETQSFITVLNLSGEGSVLMSEKFIANIKFEGVEFI